MKKKKLKIEVAPSTQVGGCANFPVTFTGTELTSYFVQTKRQTRKHNGENDCLDGLSYAAGLLAANRECFDEQKFLSMTRGYVEIGDATKVLLGLFSDYVNFMIQNGKLKRDCLIDFPIYRWV